MIHPARWIILKSKDPRHTGEGPVPMAEMDPGLRREDKKMGIPVNHPNASEH